MFSYLFKTQTAANNGSDAMIHQLYGASEYPLSLYTLYTDTENINSESSSTVFSAKPCVYVVLESLSMAHFSSSDMAYVFVFVYVSFNFCAKPNVAFSVPKCAARRGQ